MSYYSYGVVLTPSDAYPRRSDIRGRLRGQADQRVSRTLLVTQATNFPPSDKVRGIPTGTIGLIYTPKT